MKKNNKEELFDKLNLFIKKYYANLLIKGVIYAFSLLLGVAILIAILEYFNQFNVLFRTILFWIFMLFSSIILFKYILTPLLQINKIGKTISYEEAAKIIGNHFSEIQDKILNIVQLNQMNPELNDLVYASIEEKISKIKPISFAKAIDLRKNKTHLKWLIIPIGIISIFLITGKHYVLTESYARIVNHSTFFEPSAPFDYLFMNDVLESIQYEDFILKIVVVGEMLPEKVFLIFDDNELRLNCKEPHSYEYVFRSLKKDVTFRLFAGGYYSSPYTIKILPKPTILDFSVHMHYPEYTRKKNVQLKNVGDFELPEGTKVRWVFQTKNAQSISLNFNDQNLQKEIEDNAIFEKVLLKSTPYKVKVFNNLSLEDSLLYHAEVIQDQFPKIEVKKLDSSSSAKYIFEGKIEDDYCLSKLKFNLVFNDSDSVYSEKIQIEKLSKELFYYTYTFKNMPAGENFTYYFEVWDNDEINGNKSSKSKFFSFKSATEEELYTEKNQANLEIKSGLQNSIAAAKNLKREIEKLNKSLLEKKELTWEEKEKIKNLLQKHKELQEHIERMKKKAKENLTRQEQLDSSTLEKEKKLQELMEKVMDEEMKDLIKELEKMLTETNKEKIKDLLEKITKNNTDLEKELERELEIFKALEFEQELEESIEKLKQLKERQETLKKNTEEKNVTLDSLHKEQESIQNDFEDVKKDLKNLEEKNNSLENSHDLPETKENEKRVTKNMNESKDLLKQGKQKKSKKSQNKAIQNLESLLNQLEDLKSSCSGDSHEEDLESLRQILDNLITLSFDQEDLIKQTNQVSKNSAEFLSVVRNQKKLADNIVVIEDSLFALSKRVVQIQKIVNKEISAINNDMQKSTKELENRQIGKATKRQQFVMTSINNLALLLSEMLEQMQKELADKTPGEKQCNKPGSGKPSLSQLKKAQEKLNQQIKKRKNGKKGTGEGNAMELLSIVKKQEAIRKRLEELRSELGDGEKDKIDKLIQDMQENELDIVRQEIDKETIERQEKILVQLLEFEKAEKEQGEDEEKESIEWILKEESQEEDILDYEKIKKTQDELIRSTPIELTPFYRKKVNEYFNNLLIKEK